METLTCFSGTYNQLCNVRKNHYFLFSNYESIFEA